MKASPLLGFFALALTLGVACDDPAKPPEESTKVPQVLSAGCRATTDGMLLKGFQSQTKLIVRGQDRTYDWLIPDAHDGRHPIPVIFVFHGDGGTGAQIRQSYKLEDQVGGKAIFVWMDAEPTKKSWDLERGVETNADMQMFDTIVKSIQDNYCVDTNRVFVTGVSSGAYFTNQLACFRGGSIRAIASHGGGGPSSSDALNVNPQTGELLCPEKPVAALITHGSDDTEVKPSEGKFSLDYWSHVNSCRPGGLEVFDPAPCINQLSCAVDRPVVYCDVPGIGHTLWSEAPRATWKFFDQL